MKPAFRIRNVYDRDIPRLQSIDEEYGNLIEFSFQLFLKKQNHRIKVLVLSDEPEDVVVGYMSYIVGKKAFKLIRIAVDKECQRMGCGGELISKLTSLMKPGKRMMVDAYVPESDLAAQLFFKSLGFTCVNIEFTDSGDVYYLFKVSMFDMFTASRFQVQLGIK